MIAQMDISYIKSRPVKAITRLISYALFEGRPLTTKGQWINPLVFALFAIEKLLPKLKIFKKPVFFLGTGRSGSTILGKILSMHREVGFLNEPKALWHAIHPEEDLIGSYSLKPAHYRLTEEDATDELRKRANRLFGAYLAATLSKRVVDKYPELIFRVPFIRTIFPDAKFLFLVRNGWDTCRSVGGWSKRLGAKINDNEIHNWWGLNNRKWNLLLEQLVATDPNFDGIVKEVKQFSSHTDMAAVEWIVTMREGLRFLQTYPDCVHMIRYEDFVSKPDIYLNRVLEFCELPPDKKFSSYACKVLTPASSKKPLDINPAIVPIFQETMKSLGY